MSSTENEGRVFDSPARAALRAAVESEWLRGVVVMAILLNAAALGLATEPGISAWSSRTLFWIDEICILVLALEVLGRIAVWRGRFFRSGWNLFDFGVVAVSLIPADSFFSVLLTLRVLLMLRLVSEMPEMRRVVQALLNSAPGMTAVTGLLSLLIYVSAVLGCDLFGARFPLYFGTVGTSLFSMFQVMTLEGWSENIARPVMAVYPWAWTFFIAFIVLVTMAVLNLFVGGVVNSIQSAGNVASEQELAALRRDVAELKAMVRALGKPE